MSWIDIGKQMGIHKSRVIQLYQRAIGKIRVALIDDPELLNGLAESMDVTPDFLARLLKESDGKHYAFWQTTDAAGRLTVEPKQEVDESRIVRKKLRPFPKARK